MVSPSLQSASHFALALAMTEPMVVAFFLRAVCYVILPFMGLALINKAFGNYILMINTIQQALFKNLWERIVSFSVLILYAKVWRYYTANVLVSITLLFINGTTNLLNSIINESAMAVYYSPPLGAILVLFLWSTYAYNLVATSILKCFRFLRALWEIHLRICLKCVSPLSKVSFK